MGPVAAVASTAAAGSAPGDHEQEAAEEYRRAGQDLQPQPAGVVRPGLVRRVGVVEIRSDERDECAPQAEQHQQESAERSPAAPHLQHPSHDYHFLSESRSFLVRAITIWPPTR